MSKLFYRVDRRDGATITNRCPKTAAEVAKLDHPEQDYWMRVYGDDRGMWAFRMNRRRAEEKLVT